MILKRDRYSWQEKFIDRWRERRTAGETEFLLSATPGAGKTRATSRAARRMIDEGEISKVVVVTPTRNLCDSWVDDAASERLQLTSDLAYSNFREIDGRVLTYQALGTQIEILRGLCSRERVLVILDEPHHLTGDDDIDSTWGPAAFEAFAYSRYRLLATGTPWRTDGSSIPWASYDVGGFVNIGYGYSYREGLRDGVVRDVYFHRIDSDESEYDFYGELKSYESLMDVPVEEYGAALKTIHRVDFSYVPAALRSGLQKLDEFREAGHGRAGMLVACRDTTEARLVSSLLGRVLGGDEVMLAISAEAGEEVLKTFKNGSQKVIVAVQMVAEGTNIPRLRVGVHLSSRRTELSWHQLIGRTNRTTPEEEDVTYSAYWVIPRLRIFDDLAARYEEDVRIALQSREASEVRESSGDERDRSSRVIPLAANGIDAGVIGRGQDFSPAEMAGVRVAAATYGLQAERLAVFCRANGFPIPGAPVPVPPQPPEPLEEVLRRKRETVTRMANRLAFRRFPNSQGSDRFRAVRSEMNAALGISSIREDALPIEILDRMILWLDGELAKYE